MKTILQRPRQFVLLAIYLGVSSQAYSRNDTPPFRRNTVPQAELDYSSGINSFVNGQSSIDLGMNNVPVFNQIPHGTCTTFATLAALDAKYFGGDYIDEQCILSLNSSLNAGTKLNFWTGPIFEPAKVLEPLKQHGFVRKYNCFNSYYPDPQQTMSSTQYESISETNVSSTIQYKFIQGPKLKEVQKALREGHRVILGFFVQAHKQDPISTNGFDVVMQGWPRRGGLWACQQPSSLTQYCAPTESGHTVVIVGYDDEQQLLKIRNSWGTDLGDSGDFYMTYSYYNAMAYNNTVIL